MMKVNIGLIGILVITILIMVLIFNINSKNEKLYEELIVIKSFLEDIDRDIHEIEEKIKEWQLNFLFIRRR